MAVVELKENEWREFKNIEYSIIDYYGENCVACVLLGPIFDAIADEMSGVSFGRINISFYPEIADEYKVNAMPTLLYFRNGELVHQSVGSLEREELLENIASLLYQ